MSILDIFILKRHFNLIFLDTFFDDMSILDIFRLMLLLCEIIEKYKEAIDF